MKRAVLSIAAAAVFFHVAAMAGTTTAAQIPRKATTKTGVVLEVVHEGKKVGSTRIPEGREVAVIEEKAGRIKIAAGSLMSGWVDRASLRFSQIVLPSDAGTGNKVDAKSVEAPQIEPATTSHFDPASLPIDVSKELNVIRLLHNMPGISALAVKDGRIVAQGAAGFRRLGDPTPLQVTDPVNIGSCTKWITATLAGRLVDRGLIKWTTRVRDVFRNFRNFDPAFSDATLEQFLAHRSGLQDSDTFSERHGNSQSRPSETQREIRRWVSETAMGDPPEVAPGNFHYSNEGYVVAAKMMEIASGEEWEALVREQIFVPARMASGSFGPVFDNKLSPKAPVGHDVLSREDIPVPRSAGSEEFRRSVAAYGPGGGVACTLQDWAKFLNMMATLDRTDYLAPETVLKLSRHYDGDGVYGLGVRVYDRPWATPGQALSHTGSTWGLNSVFWVAPARDLVVVVFANCYAKDGTSEVATDKAAALLINRFGQGPPAGPTLEFPMILSLGQFSRAGLLDLRGQLQIISHH